jgi:hypothetical protein
MTDEITVRGLISCAETDKAVLMLGRVLENGRLVLQEFWLPKSRITMSKQYVVPDPFDPIVEVLKNDVTMPLWLANENGLVGPAQEA